MKVFAVLSVIGTLLAVSAAVCMVGSEPVVEEQTVEILIRDGQFFVGPQTKTPSGVLNSTDQVRISSPESDVTISSSDFVYTVLSDNGAAIIVLPHQSENGSMLLGRDGATLSVMPGCGGDHESIRVLIPAGQKPATGRNRR